jgi:hypothetical protein
VGRFADRNEKACLKFEKRVEECTDHQPFFFAPKALLTACSPADLHVQVAQVGAQSVQTDEKMDDQ